MKKILTLSTLLFFCALIPHVFATQDFVPLAGIPGLTQGATADTVGLANFFNNLYKYLIGVAAILAVIMIIWGGLEISTQDSISKKGAGKEKIYNAIFGLVLVLSPALIFSIINPSILNLSLNLPPLKTAQYSGALGSGGVTQNTIDQTSGCSVSGTAGILQIATCSSSDAKNTWAQTCAGALGYGQTTNPSNGVVTYTVTCSAQSAYVFINKGSSVWSTITLQNGITSLAPLVSTASNPNNGSDAMTFMNECGSVGNLGFDTCISDTTTFSSPVPCNLTGPNAATTWKCYTEKLSCRKLATSLNPFCSNSPGWTPFQ
ncbi:MAG: pilin [Minisyncoccota bacterium]